MCKFHCRPRYQMSRFVSRVEIQAPALRCCSQSVECKELLSGIQCYSDKVCSDPCSYNLILHPLACGGWERISDRNPPTMLNISKTSHTALLLNISPKKEGEFILEGIQCYLLGWRPGTEMMFLPRSVLCMCVSQTARPISAIVFCEGCL